MSRRRTGALAAGLTLLGVLHVGAPAAQAATPFCPSTDEVTGTVTGNVTTGEAEYWRASGPATAREFVLQPVGGDADLRIYAANCTTVLCTSTAGGTSADTCTITEPGTVYPRVNNFSGSSVDYTLTVSGGTVPPLFPPSGYPSDDCNTGSVLAEGIVAGNYVRMRTYKPDARTTFVCVRAEGASLTFGGKFTVVDPSVTLPGTPTTDSNVNSCATTGGNQVPGPHPLLAGAVGDPSDPTTYLPFLVDSYATSGAAWVCLRAGATSVRAIVPTAVGATPPSVNFSQDLPGSHTSTFTAPTVGSGACQTGGGTRFHDVMVAGSRSYLYTWQATPTVLKVCVRAQGFTNAGGVLTIDHTNLNGALPSVTTGSDIAPCTIGVVRLDQPAVLEVRRSTASAPASACVTVGSTTLRVTASTGSGQQPVAVTWTEDTA